MCSHKQLILTLIYIILSISIITKNNSKQKIKKFGSEDFKKFKNFIIYIHIIKLYTYNYIFIFQLYIYNQTFLKIILLHCCYCAWFLYFNSILSLIYIILFIFITFFFNVIYIFNVNHFICIIKFD